MPIIQDPDGILGKSQGALSSGGGYDTEELQQAHEALSGHVGDEKGYEKVDPIFIRVTDNPAVSEKEFEARVVVIEYDERGEVVSVELL